MELLFRSKKNRAYSIYMEFGPKLRIPRSDRLATKFKDIPAETIALWMKEFEQIEALIWKAAEHGENANRVWDLINQEFKTGFPDYDKKSVRTACNRAMYYAWHEGYI